jgi:hypothetical protein
VIPKSIPFGWHVRRRPIAVACLGAAALTLAGCGGSSGSRGYPSSIGSPGASLGPSLMSTIPVSVPGAESAAPYSRVVASRLAYPWRWPNDVADPGQVVHTNSPPPVPELIRIAAGSHPSDPDQRPFDRMSFTFTTGFPSYRFEFLDRLTSDPRGEVIPLRGVGVLRVAFADAQAHTSTPPAHATVDSQPARPIGFRRIADYAQSGDFEGVVSYGIGVSWPIPRSNPQLAVRAYETELVTADGQHLYVVAIDLDAADPGKQ